MKVYAKGGYKKYTIATDTSYYYDNVTPSDIRPTTDAGGLAAISNLVPGAYVFCGDNASTSCKIGSTTYYLAAAVPYAGTNPFNPVNVPTYDIASPPATTYPYGGNNYLQKVRLILTTQSAFPRITSITPSNVSASGGTIGSFNFAVNGANLPCSSVAASCGTVVKFGQGASTYTASCTGTTGALLNCSVNLSGATIGNTSMTVTASGYTLSIPGTPLIGGVVVAP
jgi:hypothetical protein